MVRGCCPQSKFEVLECQSRGSELRMASVETGAYLLSGCCVRSKASVSPAFELSLGCTKVRVRDVQVLIRSRASASPAGA